MARKSPTNTSPITAALFQSAAEEQTFMMALIQRIVDECPRRVANSDDERRAQEILSETFGQLPLRTHYEPFSFNESLYANIALHFGVSVLGSLVGTRAPIAGGLLQGLAAYSYWSDSTRNGYLLRRLLPWGQSQNLIATSPAKSGEPRLRVVLIGHADAAFTGWIFNPEFMKRALNSPLPDNMRFLDRMMEVATRSAATGAAFDLMRGLVKNRRLSVGGHALRTLVAIAPLLVTAMNLQIVIKNEVVPGANDNLTGCAVLPVLASRLLPHQPDDVEYVFVVAGSEETSLGGSDALARAHLADWSPENTVVLAVDTLSGGDIRFVEREGELQPLRISDKLRHALQDAISTDPRFRTIRGFDMPVGGTDAQPFARRGYHATAITCVDPEIGAPRHYHHPSDLPENIDVARFMESADFIEAAVQSVVRSYRGV